MTKDWEVKTLGEICKISTGKANANQSIEDGEYAFFDRSKTIKRSDKFIFDCEALIIPGEGAQFFPRYFKGKFNLHQRAYALFDFNKEAYIRFVEYSLILKHKYFEEVAVGATVKSLRLRHFQDFTLSLPPIEEQKRIVKILDEKFETVEVLKKITQEELMGARELFENYVFDVFFNPKVGWISSTLSEVCEKITDGTHQTPKYFNEGIVFLSSRNVTSRKIDWENIKYIDKVQHEAMHKRVAPRMGDILLAKNGTTGVAAKVDRDTVFDIYVSLAHLRPLDFMDSDFLLYFINSLVAKKQFNKRLKGMGVPNLHLNEIREVVISYPKSRLDQKAVVKELDQLSEKTKELSAIFVKKTADLEELKKSYLHEAFSGKL